MIAGRYRLLEPLARGATSSVWRARDVDADRDVAMKILRDDGVDPALRVRAEREAHVLTGISHPNLVEVLDSGLDDEHPFLVMALLEGEALNRIIATRGRLPVDEAVGLVADVADGLGVAHDAGVVHRDVKPGNIVCHEQVPTLVDFGIARAIDATTLTRGLVVGTASYLAPEQAQGAAITPAADVYSLGCVLYELLTGRPPFTGDSPVSIALQHVQADATPPGDLVDIPAAVDAVVMTALSKEPSRRPADGHALAIALRRAIDGDMRDETISIAPAAPIDGTPVLPITPAAAVAAVSPDADLIDPSPLATPPPAPAATTPRRRSSPSTIVAVALAVAATVIFLALLFASFGGHGDSSSGPVPKVAGATVAQATTYLEGAGWDADINNVTSDAPAGTVLASDPAAGTMLSHDETVTLSVSSGPVAPPTTQAPLVDVRVGHGKGKKHGD
ncbi:MAG: eukaryotic-like serine/threonine-protein kinase [Actinomycetota bacterium]